ncbi:MAG: hypothetical protein ACRENI_05680 [Gemmatimonadaceae bacterium]
MTPKRKFPALASLALALVCACTDGADTGGRSAVVACAEPGDSAIAAAVHVFVDSVVPRPTRFLASVGDGTTLPAAGQAVLRSRGPTYLYPEDSTQRQAVRDRLAEVGDFATLLVRYRGVERVDDDDAVVRLDGAFVGGNMDGIEVPPREVELVCNVGVWREVTAEADAEDTAPSSPADSA